MILRMATDAFVNFGYLWLILMEICGNALCDASDAQDIATCDCAHAPRNDPASLVCSSMEKSDLGSMQCTPFGGIALYTVPV